MIQEKESERSRPQIIDRFLRDPNIFSQEDKNRLAAIQSSLIGDPKMDDNSAVGIMIPASVHERQLMQTLRFYAEQQPLDNARTVDVTILINGEEGEKLTASQAYSDALYAQDTYHNLNLAIATVNYPMNNESSTLKIGTIRKDLAALSLYRAAQAKLDPQELILVTNDADALYIPEKYTRKIDQLFHTPQPDGSKVAGATMFIDYDNEVYEKNHLIFVAKRFFDVIEIVERYETGRSYFRSGNSAYRAVDYIASGGFSNRRIYETTPIIDTLSHAGAHLVHKRWKELTITTDERRMVHTIMKNRVGDSLYTYFGKKEDRTIYQDDQETTSFLITDEAFGDALYQYINGMYNRRIQRADEQTIQVVQRQIQKAAKIMGIAIVFSGRELAQISYEKLQTHLQKRTKDTNEKTIYAITNSDEKANEA